MCVSGAHTVLVGEGGQLWSWGRDEGDGRLGVADAAALGADGGGSPLPLRVALRRGGPHAAAGGGPSGESMGAVAAAAAAAAVGSEVAAVRAAAGGFHTLAVDAEGCVWGWGGNRNGELGRGGRVGGWRPTPVSGLEGVRVSGIAAGGMHSAGEGGRAGRWLTAAPKGGRQQLLALWIPPHLTFPLTFPPRPPPLPPPLLPAAWDVDGRVFTWGAGKAGQLGHGDRESAVRANRGPRNRWDYRRGVFSPDGHG